MKTKFSIIMLSLLLASNYLLGQTATTEILYFDSDESALSDSTKSQLNKMLQGGDILEVLIVGHADAKGSDLYNADLSMRRADAVADFLRFSGISDALITSEYYGESISVANNDIEQERAKNRRVEIHVFRKGSRQEGFFENFEEDYQRFTRAAKDSFEIVGFQGTIIHFPKGCLENERGEVITGEIEVELKEFYKRSDMIKANLMTMSNDRILETGGMIYLTASFSGEELRLREGFDIRIDFANNGDMDRMQTFAGAEKDGQINWIPQISRSQRIVEVDNYEAVRFERVYIGDGYFRTDTFTDRSMRSKIERQLLSSKLGWINCDRFLKLKNRTNLIVRTNLKKNTYVRLIFKSINSIMPGSFRKNGVVFSQIPKGSRATLIAMSEQGEESFYISKEIIVGQNKIENLELTKTSMEDIALDLNKFN